MAGNTLPGDVGRSFRNADLVVEATDGTGTRYIAMEVSFTADLRDCNRAVRNARLIESFTGKPAQPAIASVRNDREAAEAVESGVHSTGTSWRTGRRVPSEQRRTTESGTGTSLQVTPRQVTPRLIAQVAHITGHIGSIEPYRSG